MYYDHGWFQPQVFYFISKIISPNLVFSSNNAPQISKSKKCLPEHNWAQNITTCNVSHPFFLRESYERAEVGKLIMHIATGCIKFLASKC
jgi:hypothetical protein